MRRKDEFVAAYIAWLMNNGKTDTSAVDYAWRLYEQKPAMFDFLFQPTGALS